MPYPDPSSSPAPVLVTPGPGWTRFTYARADMELLGVVQIGMQIGALARLSPGCYAQVNGDFVAALDAASVERALRRSGLASPGAPAAAAPTVTVKKRRRIAMAPD